MQKGRAIIRNEKGLHLRPTRVLCDYALKFSCKIILKVREYEVSAKSILGVLSARIKTGEEIEIICEGEGEEEALNAILILIEKRFDEDNGNLTAE